MWLACAVAALIAAHPAGMADDAKQEPAVKLLAPPDRARISHPDPSSAVTTFAWRAEAPPSAYRLVIARDAAFDGLVVNRRATSESVGVKGLAPGTYYWHVQLLDDDDAPVSISATATFEIARRESP